MAPEVLTERLLLVASVTLLMLGGVTAWSSTNVAKRLVGIGLAQLGAIIALAALRAPDGVLVAGVAVSFAGLAIGLSLLVRLQEAYRGVEVAAFDEADAESEPAEPSA